jgi:hypothetical protein
MTELLNSGVTLVVDRYAFSGVAFSAAKPVSLFLKIYIGIPVWSHFLIMLLLFAICLVHNTLLIFFLF